MAPLLYSSSFASGCVVAGHSPFELVTDRDRLARAVKAALREPVVALDTEANGYHRYPERVCLIQLATPKRLYVIDPIEIDDMSPLGQLIESPARREGHPRRRLRHPRPRPRLGLARRQHLRFQHRRQVRRHGEDRPRRRPRGMSGNSGREAEAAAAGRLEPPPAQRRGPCLRRRRRCPHAAPSRRPARTPPESWTRRLGRRGVHPPRRDPLLRRPTRRRSPASPTRAAATSTGGAAPSSRSWPWPARPKPLRRGVPTFRIMRSEDLVGIAAAPDNQENVGKLLKRSHPGFANRLRRALSKGKEGPTRPKATPQRRAAAHDRRSSRRG